MPLQRVRVHWNGLSGGAGVNTLFFQDAPADPAPDLRTFYNALTTWIPTAVSITVDNFGDLVDEVTGTLAGAWTGTAAATVSGAGSGGFPGAGGAVVDLVTSTVVGKRRLQGRLFLVPLVGAYDGDGSLTSTFLSAARGAATALLASPSGPNLRVWHRPKHGVAGSAAAVTSTRVPDLSAVLRSRRS